MNKIIFSLTLLLVAGILNAQTNNTSTALIEKCQSLGYVKGTERMKQCISGIYSAKNQDVVDEQAVEKCQSLGYVKGTERMKQCIYEVYTKKQQNTADEVLSTNVYSETVKGGATNPLEAKCDSYGFQRGTTAYSQCLMNMDAQNNQAAYQQSLQQQQLLKNGAELLRGDGRTPGSMNCYRTPGGANSLYCQ